MGLNYICIVTCENIRTEELNNSDMRIEDV